MKKEERNKVNIFENAKFDDKFITRDGNKAIYINDKIVYEPLSRTNVLYAHLVMENGVGIDVVKEPGVFNGVHPVYDELDIVSREQTNTEIISDIIDCIYFAEEYHKNIPFNIKELDEMVCFLQNLK